jgi:Flp pilus assembly secretin CpaC
VDAETGLPSEETTEIETDVLLTSGQGVVIGGLIQETDNYIVSKVPLLGEIPYLGVLFQRRSVTKSRQEIIVTLKPHVLPYSPILHDQLAHDFMRTEQPLTQGALQSFPRPYEPRIADVFKHEEEKHHKYGKHGKHGMSAGMPVELSELPSAEESFHMVEPRPYEPWDGVRVEELPAPAREEIVGPALRSK